MSSERVWRWVAIAFCVFLVFVAYAADVNRLPGVFIALCGYPGGDKVGHFCLYGTFAFFGAKGFRRPARVGSAAVPMGILPAIVLAVLEETSQLFFPHRSPDLLDLGAGFAGIAVAAVLVRVGPLRNRAAAPPIP